MLLQIQFVRHPIVRDESTCATTSIPSVQRLVSWRGNTSICHSESAPAGEEFLLGVNPRKEKFLGAQRVSEKQIICFFRQP
jgi:hypothetical protein